MQTFLADDVATEAFGAQLAATLAPGDIVSLEGDLGAGKTALARAVIRALAEAPDLEVPSPTFALIQPYETTRGPVLHADLYRLSSVAEADELGLLDDETAIVLVEWAERVPEIAQAANLQVRLEMGPGGVGRNVQVLRI